MFVPGGISPPFEAFSKSTKLLSLSSSCAVLLHRKKSASRKLRSQRPVYTYDGLLCLFLRGLWTWLVQSLSRRSHLSHLTPGASFVRMHFALARAHAAQAAPHFAMLALLDFSMLPDGKSRHSWCIVNARYV